MFGYRLNLEHYKLLKTNLEIKTGKYESRVLQSLQRRYISFHMHYIARDCSHYAVPCVDNIWPC